MALMNVYSSDEIFKFVCIESALSQGGGRKGLDISLVDNGPC